MPRTGRVMLVEGFSCKVGDRLARCAAYLQRYVVPDRYAERFEKPEHRGEQQDLSEMNISPAQMTIFRTQHVKVAQQTMHYGHI